MWDFLFFKWKHMNLVHAGIYLWGKEVSLAVLKNGWSKGSWSRTQLKAVTAYWEEKLSGLKKIKAVI